MRIWKRRAIEILGIVIVVGTGGVAWAHRSPSNCNANNPNIALVNTSGKTEVVNGETVTYIVNIGNQSTVGGQINCDLTGATITFFCPGANGEPDGTHPIVLAVGRDFPSGTPAAQVGTPQTCTINVNAGVTFATAAAVIGDFTVNPDGSASAAPPRTCTVANPCTKGTVHAGTADVNAAAQAPLPVTVLTCAVKVDKQISCDGGLTFHDVGLETMDEDGHADLCLGWNASATTPAEPIKVRYVVANAGTEPAADLVNCTVTESNAGFPAPGTVANPISGFACPTDTD